eukprot:14344728-Alexandrium_andersonii.AAC.1
MAVCLLSTSSMISPVNQAAGATAPATRAPLPRFLSLREAPELKPSEAPELPRVVAEVVLP